MTASLTQSHEELAVMSMPEGARPVSGPVKFVRRPAFP